ncbi:MAG: type II secretion system F family protein [Phycisphaerae bacterium]|nr:type II secretion system F family protein [Phycisphaerae bacterium]
MPRYSYIAIDQKHKSAKGTVTAESPYAARKHLRAKGLHPTDIREMRTAREGGGIGLVFGKSKKNQVADFTKQLATMLKAGIKLTEALGVLVQQISDPRLRNTVTDIRDRVVTGESFADALGEYDNYFDVIFVSMVRVGEVTGTLEGSLLTIAAFMEKRQRMESKMITAMIYPAILICFCIGAVIFLTIKVIPVIAAQIEKTGQQLPGVTRLLVAFSNILTSWRLLVVIAVIALIVWGVRVFVRTQRGAYLRDKLLLALPVFGPLVKQRIVARFASTLSTLLSSGLSMAESLKVVAQVTGNTIMNTAVKQARDRILSGADIATPLRESGVIDPAIGHMVAVGEKSGELEHMLKTISENLESSTDIVIERLSAAIEPVIIVFMAFIVGVIAYATLLPILRFSSGQM